MTDSDTPPTETPAPKLPSTPLFSQANITTGLATLAVILAAAPYVVPQLQSYQVQAGLMNKPAVLELAINKLQVQHQAEQQAQLNDQVKKAEAMLKSNPDVVNQAANDPTVGAVNGKVKIYEFLDYNCGVCRAVAPELKSYMAANPDVTIVVKQFPVITQISPTLAAYALVANEDGHYAKVHEAFMTAKIHDEADILITLNGLGLNAQTMQARAHAAEIQDRVNNGIKLGASLGLNGTPAFVVGGTLIPSADLKALEVSISAARAAKS